MVDNLPSVDRRTFTLGALITFTAACSPSSSEGRAQQGNSGAPPSPDPFASARPVNDQFWMDWRDRFIAPEGRVVDTGNNRISHSEGQSYGLLFAYRAGDRDTFQRIADWTQKNLGRTDMALHSWRYDPHAAVPVSDPNNATDGDLVIAWALSLAGQRWANSAWTNRSHDIREAIRSHCVVERFGRTLLLPGITGFATETQVMLNPSYFVWPALDRLARQDGAAWSPIIRDCEAVLRAARFGPHQLPTDWIAVTGANQIAPAPDKPPRFGYDAIRVPLYAALSQRGPLVAPIADFWRSYSMQNRQPPAWIDVTTGEQAPYALSAGGAAIEARLIGTPPPRTLDADYFSASLQMLARL